MLKMCGSHCGFIISSKHCGFWHSFAQSYRSWHFLISSLKGDNSVVDIGLLTLKMSCNSIFDDTPRFSSSITNFTILFGFLVFGFWFACLFGLKDF